MEAPPALDPGTRAAPEAEQNPAEPQPKAAPPTLIDAPEATFPAEAGGFTDVAIDGRNFLMVPNEDYSETTAYEIDGDQAIKGFKIRGSSYDMRRVR